MKLDVNAFGHVGNGTIHFDVLGAERDEAIAINVAGLAVLNDFRDSISAAHGVGQYRVEDLAACKSTQ